jgi:uncharacterized protein
MRSEPADAVNTMATAPPSPRAQQPRPARYGPVAALLALPIVFYRRVIGPVLGAVAGPRCRFHPSCSQYALDALRERGAVVGVGLAVWRVLRCQPFCRGGYDPVPPRHRRRLSDVVRSTIHPKQSRGAARC